MKTKEIALYMKWVDDVAQMSYCERLKVGALIVKGNSVISYGYNGTPYGRPNVCEIPDGSATKAEVIHAERNAITKAAVHGISTVGASIFCTHAPCEGCAADVVQAKIMSLYYRYDYRSSAGLELLRSCGVETVAIDPNYLY